MKYNISFKDDKGWGFGVESDMIEDGGPERVCRIFEIESHSIQPEFTVVLEHQLSPLIKSLIAVERLTKEVH